MKEFLALLLLFSLPVYADVSGTINFTYVNATTGLFAYTVNLCNTTSDCFGMTCFADYDGTGTAGSAGWCNISSTGCYHDNTRYASAATVCYSNTTYFTCNSGNWSSLSTCSSGQTCANPGGAGSCSSPSSSTSSSSSSSNLSTTASQRKASLIFTSYPISFNITQGTTATKYAVIKNNGNVTLYNVTFSLTGLSWYTADPAILNRSIINGENIFTITFTAPSDATIGVNHVALRVAGVNATATSSFDVFVNPSNETVQEQIFPDYTRYVALLNNIETNMVSLQDSGADVQDLQSLLLNAKSKLSQANRSIETKDYSSATQYLDDAKSLLDQATIALNAIPEPTTPVGTDLTLIIVIVAVCGVAAVVIYLFLPEKGKSEKSWIPPEEKKKGFFRRKKEKW